MSGLSNTSRVQRLDASTRECLCCSAFTVLELHACVSTCHASSQREQRKIALGARRALNQSLDSVLIPLMEFQHPELRPAVAEAELRAAKLDDRLIALEALQQAASVQKAKAGKQSKDVQLLKQRLMRLGERLSEGDVELARVAGEAYDLEERVREVCGNEDDENRTLQRLTSDIRPLRSDLQKIKSEQIKQELDHGMIKMNLGKRVRDQGNKRANRSERWNRELESQRRDLPRENDSLRFRVREKNDQMQVLEGLWTVRSQDLTRLDSEVDDMKLEQHTMQGIKPAMLLCITAQVFGPYKRINKFRRETKEKMDTLRVQLGTLKRR